MTVDPIIAVFEAVDRHFLHALRMFWYRVIAFGLGQTILLSVFVWRYGGSRADDDAMAVVLAAFGIAVSVLAAVVAVATVQRVAAWRAAFLDAGVGLDPSGVLERAESSHPIANPTQAAALLPAIAATCWAAALVIYAVGGQ